MTNLENKNETAYNAVLIDKENMNSNSLPFNFIALFNNDSTFFGELIIKIDNYSNYKTGIIKVHDNLTRTVLIFNFVCTI